MSWNGIDRRRHGASNRARRAFVSGFVATYRRQSEVAVGFLLLVVGLWLVLPFQTFPVATSYAWLVTIGIPEWMLGLALAGIGGLALVAGVLGIHWLRRLALLLVVGGCVFMAASYILGAVASLGAVIFGALALIAFGALVYLEWAAEWTSRREL